MMECGTIESEFKDLDSTRTYLLEVAKQCSALTLNYVMPYEAVNGKLSDSGERLTANQSFCARAVSTFISKTLMALAPADQPFWATDYARKQQQTSQEYAKSLAKVSVDNHIIFNALEQSNMRTALRRDLEQIVICGLGVMSIDDDLQFEAYRYDNVAIRMDGRARIYLVIVRENKLVDRLSDDTLAILAANNKKAEDIADDGMVEMFTRQELGPDGMYHITQEISGIEISSSKLPVPRYIPCGYAEATGDGWPRSMCEEVLPDFTRYDTLTMALSDAAVNAAKMVPIYDPTKMGRRDHFLQENGKPVEGRINANGNPEGLGFLQTNKYSDFAFATNEKNIIESRIAKAFLMESEAVRQAERVTAYELSNTSREFADAQGHYYAQIAEELLRPMLRRIIYILSVKQKVLKEITLDNVDIKITTGFAALARQARLQRTLAVIQVLAQDPKFYEEKFNSDKFEQYVLKDSFVDGRTFLNTPEEIAQNRQMRAQQAAMEQMATAAAQSTGEGLGQMVTQ